jgi:hypothetical protein
MELHFFQHVPDIRKVDSINTWWWVEKADFPLPGPIAYTPAVIHLIHQAI